MYDQVSEEKKQLARLLYEIFKKRRDAAEKKGDRRYTQKRMADEMGLRGDTAFSDWLNETRATMPSTKYAPNIARMIDEMNNEEETRLYGDDGRIITGAAIYELLHIEEPMPSDPAIREAVRLMEEQPRLKPILKHLIKRPEDIEKFRELMENLEASEHQPSTNNHHGENGVAPA